MTTRPVEVNGLGLSAEEASNKLREIDDTFILLPEPQDIAKRWADLVIKHRILGKRAHDAKIAALMISHGITHILTLNPSDFASYTEITPVVPTEVI